MSAQHNCGVLALRLAEFSVMVASNLGRARTLAQILFAPGYARPRPAKYKMFDC
jgi:hypothetical protein